MNARLEQARKAARPVRKMMSWLALVDEERAERAAADDDLSSVVTDVAGLRAEMARVEGLGATLRSDFGPIEARTTEHTDLVVAEALRRSEAVDARLATEHQRIAEMVERI